MRDEVMEADHDGEGADDGMVCLYCGGPVDGDGKYSAGGVVHDDGDGEGRSGTDSSRGPKEHGKGRTNGQDAFDEFAGALLRRAARGL